MVCNKGRASCRFSHIHVIIMSCWILRTLRCPWSEGPQAHNTPDCVPLATHMHIKSLRYTDQLNLLASPVAYHHQPSLIYTFTTHHPYFIHFPYHIHYPFFNGLLTWQGNTQKSHCPCLKTTSYEHGWVTREGGSWLPRMLTQSSHPILISRVMPVLEQLKSESAFLYLVFFIIFYNRIFTYYSIVITIHLSNLPFPF